MSDDRTEAWSDPDDDDIYSQERHDDEFDHGADEGGTWLDEGLISLVIIAGVVLFLIPEPATSGLGVFLIVAGAIAWVIDWAM